MKHFFFSLCSSGEWEHWTQRVQEYIYPDDEVPEYSSILVPNVDNVRTNFLMDTIAKQHKVEINITSIAIEYTDLVGAPSSVCIWKMHLQLT